MSMKETIKLSYKKTKEWRVPVVTVLNSLLYFGVALNMLIWTRYSRGFYFNPLCSYSYIIQSQNVASLKEGVRELGTDH